MPAVSLVVGGQQLDCNAGVGGTFFYFDHPAFAHTRTPEELFIPLLEALVEAGDKLMEGLQLLMPEARMENVLIEFAPPVTLHTQ